MGQIYAKIYFLSQKKFYTNCSRSIFVPKQNENLFGQFSCLSTRRLTIKGTKLQNICVSFFSIWKWFYPLGLLIIVCQVNLNCFRDFIFLHFICLVFWLVFFLLQSCLKWIRRNPFQIRIRIQFNSTQVFSCLFESSWEISMFMLMSLIPRMKLKTLEKQKNIWPQFS